LLPKIKQLAGKLNYANN